MDLFNHRSNKQKPDLIIIGPPGFDEKRDDPKSISMLPRQEYLEFFEGFFALLKQHAREKSCFVINPPGLSFCLCLLDPKYIDKSAISPVLILIKVGK